MLHTMLTSFKRISIFNLKTLVNLSVGSFISQDIIFRIILIDKPSFLNARYVDSRTYMYSQKLTLKALNYFCSNRGDQCFFQFGIIIMSCSLLFPIHLNTMLWVYGHYKYVYSYNEGIDFSRQNLTSIDARFCRLKSIPALQGLTEYT